MASKKLDQIKSNAGKMINSAQTVRFEQPNILQVGVELTGTAPMIQNNFSQKSIEQMLRKHMGLSVQREVKRPRDVLEDAKIYNTDGRICVKPGALKLAMVEAASQVKSLKKTQLRVGVYVAGNSLPITYDKMVERMDMVRVGMRMPDVRFRPQFNGWKLRAIIQYSEMFAVDTVLDLIQRAGNVGLGEYRPQKNGNYGTFTLSRCISDKKELAEVVAECSSDVRTFVIPEWALDLDIDPTMLSKMFASESETDAEDVAAQ